MADYAPNFTARYRFRYSTVGVQHTMQFRMPSGTTVSNIGTWLTKIAGFLNAMAPYRFADWNALSASFAQANSDLFFPASLPTGISVGTVPVPADITFSHRSLSYSFPGRSLAGQRGITFLISTGTGTLTAAQFADARVTALENAAIATAVNSLNGAPAFVANDDVALTYYPYADLKYNSYWNRKSRG